MNELANLVLSGLVTGAIYSIMASGLVVTYTTSGIFNFAHGAVAFATAYLYYQLNTGMKIPIVPSVIICVVLFAPMLGLLLDRVLLRRLSKAPVYARIVGTIGLLVALPALVQWLVVAVGNDWLDLGLVGNEATTNGVPVAGVGPTPHHNYRLFSGVVLNSDQIAVFIAAALAAFVLWFVIRRTRVGLEMRAVVDRESLAGLRGVNASRTSAVAWVMTMILAGLGGVLIAPLFTLQETVYTLVVLGSLAAVVLGGLRSIPIAFAGGLALGVVQNLVAGYSDDVLPHWLSNLSGLKSSVPFVLVLVLLLIFGRDRSRRAGSVADDVPRPDHRTGMSALRRRAPWVIATVTLVAFSMQWFDASWLRADTYDQTVIAQSLAAAIIFLSFVVVTGIGGMVSLAQATFVTAGGFGAGWALSRDWGVDIPGIATHGQINFFWAAVIGTAAAAALGALIALPMTKLGGVSLALGTLSFAFLSALVPFATTAISHGELGWTIRQPSLDVPGLNWLNGAIAQGNPVIEFDQPKLDFSRIDEQILLFLVVFGLVTLTIHSVQRSASGRAILAVRSSEVAAAASGVRVDRTKVMMFALSAGIAGLGGTMLGLFSFSISNSTAPPLVGLFWLALAVLFGVRRPGGALLAGFAFAGGTAVFHWLADVIPGGTVNALVTSALFVPILSGLGAIQLAQEPDGLLAFGGQARLAKRREKKRAERIAAAEAAVHDGVVPEHERAHRVEPAPVPAERAAHARPERLRVRSRRRRRGHVLDAQHRRRVRRRRGAARGRPGARRRRGRRAARRQRCGEVHVVLRRCRASRSISRHGAAERAGRHARPVVQARPRRRAARPRGPWHLPRSDRGGEPVRLPPRRATAGPRVRALPDPRRAPEAGRGAAVGRRAADAEPRARARRSSRGAHRRRADPRARAARRRHDHRGDLRAAPSRVRRPPRRGARARTR